MSDFNHERILIEGLLEGNEKIFDYLFHLYYSGLVVYVEHYVSDKIVAEDIVQDFFVKLWINHKTLSIKQSLRSYFFTSVKNRAIDYLRHQQVKEAVEKKMLKETELVSGNQEQLLESELRVYIDKALDKLPPVCREIFVMNRFEGLKPAEIAAKKGISVRTVETHIGKALKIMRTELEKYLPASLVTLIINSLC